MGWLGCLAHGVASGLGHTLKGLSEATKGYKVLLRGHSGHRAAGFVIIELPSIGKAQSLYGSYYATVCICIVLSLSTVLCDHL